MARLDEVHRRDEGVWRVRDAAAHGRRVRSMFARISGGYDRMNHLLSLNLDQSWRRNLARRLDDDAWEVLDLCAGTGDLALACRRAGKGRAWLAADFCPEMLRGARGKDGAEDLRPVVADCLRLPLPDWTVDAVVVGFGVRNLADVRAGLDEMTRVLRPGGQIALLDFYRDAPAAAGEERGKALPARWLVNSVVPLLGRAMVGDGHAYGYLPGSVGEFLTPGQMASLLREYGYVNIYVQRQTFGIAHLVGGRRPSA
ncbi:MAG: ubiquinone/menaquinone biosynthesis methyltransferase [Candidatus Krumholzibacteriia bacterium]